MNLFKKKTYVPINIKHQQEIGATPVIPDGLWVKCPNCGKTIYSKSLGKYKTCPTCGGCFRLSAHERIAIIADEGSFVETDAAMRPKNPISFPDYDEKLRLLQERTGLNDAVVTGECRINGIKTALCVMDSNFAMGSMGSVVGEKVTKTFERAMESNLPVVIFTVSGGARMQEGIVSLMQMAKVSAAVARHSEKGLLYVTVLTDPTTGGVTASFAMLGDIILAEPGAVIGFAGRRVIAQTIKQKLPEDFQTAEFVLEHGFVDKIVERAELKSTLAKILAVHLREASTINGVDMPRQTPEPKARKSQDNPKAKPSQIEAYDKVKIARRVARPTSLEYIDFIFDDFLEFHGDRNFKDDKAVVGGIAFLNERPVTVIGIQRGRTTEENILRNFGSPHPEGYRKALRLMKQAEKFSRPLIIFINTSGAFCGIGAEERGQGEAIARNLFEMSKLRTPVISIVIGEGGSGGALALAVADRVWMLGNSVYSILSPEGFASILWKDAGRASEAAGIMKLTPNDLLELEVIDKIIEEPAEGAERDFENIAEEIKAGLLDELSELGSMDWEDLIEKRYCRFRNFGEFEE